MVGHAAASAVCHIEQGTGVGSVRDSRRPQGSGAILGQVEEHERRGLREDDRHRCQDTKRLAIGRHDVVFVLIPGDLA